MVQVQNDHNVIEIEAHYYLMQVFNNINEQRSSIAFLYRGVKFWRENHEFATERNGKKVSLGEIVDFEEFKKALRL
jgi:hypothetical protein